MSFRSLALLFVTVSLIGCGACLKTEPLPMSAIEKNYDRPLEPGALALRLVDEESEYPDFSNAWYRAKGTSLRKSIEHSLDYLATPSSRGYFPVGPITHEQTVKSLKRFQEVLDGAASPDDLNDLVRRNFDVYMSVGCDDEGTVLFTGYYSPVFEGSLKRTERFKYPLHKLPPSIQKDKQGNIVGGPWLTRAQLETSRVLEGHELVWLADRFEAYVLTVQGSGFVRLRDGTMMEVGYAGNNGYDYSSVGKLLVDDDKIKSTKLSLATMIAHFRKHPDDMDKYLHQNHRYIFFQQAKGGPFGCLGRPVTARHSIATDKDIFPRGSLVFVDTKVPQPKGRRMHSFRQFVLDQDRGAAIRAPGRCDIYMGVGREAGRIAGFTYSEGKMYYLVAKDSYGDEFDRNRYARRGER